jgi:hypothetical protein
MISDIVYTTHERSIYLKVLHRREGRPSVPTSRPCCRLPDPTVAQGLIDLLERWDLKSQRILSKASMVLTWTSDAGT